MVQANVKIMEELKAYLQTIVEDETTRRRFCYHPQHFCRNRKLSLHKLIILILTMLKRSLSIEIQEFFDVLGQPHHACTKAAFCQQRLKLKPLLFQVLNRLVIDSFHQHYGPALKTWKGLRLLAGDGSSVYLPDNKHTIAHFGTQPNGTVNRAMARIVQIHDVLNDMTMWGGIFPWATSEREALCEHLGHCPPGSVLLLDRGFPAYWLMYRLLNEERPVHFVMRCSVGFNAQVEAFMSSHSRDTTVELQASASAVKDLGEQGYFIGGDTKIKVRMVKIRLKGAVEEVLLTNLYDSHRYSLQDLKEVYGMRWGIETLYSRQKNQLQLEVSSGQRPLSIEQDYYAGLFMSNVQSLLKKQCETYEMEVSEHRQYNYKVNNNVGVGVIKSHIVKLMLLKDTVSRLLKIQKGFERHMEPVRANRTYGRIVKGRRSKGKYQPFSNYKRAI